MFVFQDFLDSGVHETKSLQGDEAGLRTSPDKMAGASLTESQQKALTGRWIFVPFRVE